MWDGWTLALSALAFSVSYAFVKYYVIRDTTLGYNPVLFSLVYPYHFAMALVFGLAAYGLLRAHVVMRGLVPILIMIGALLSSMLAVEDFTWFALRASAPVQGDANAGRLIMSGEWTTQFIGSVDAHFYRDTKLVLFERLVLGGRRWRQGGTGRSWRQPHAVTCLRRKSRRLASFPLSAAS